jgi:hypothetical protein
LISASVLSVRSESDECPENGGMSVRIAMIQMQKVPQLAHHGLNSLEEMDKHLDQVPAETEEECAGARTLAKIWEEPFTARP